MKIQKKKFFFGGGGGSGRGEFGVGGHRVDVNKELKFFVKIKKKNWGDGGQGRCTEK